MTGRQVIIVNRAFTLEELEAFMQEKWDRNEYNGFLKGRPTSLSVEEYILLPATQRFTVIVYPRAAKGILNKENKVILTVCDTPEGWTEGLFAAIPSNNAFFGAWKIGSTVSREKERKGPAEEILLKYSEYMKQLLSDAGYTKNK